MEQILLIIQVVACVFLVLLVLVQQGKGATMGAAFGSGASNTVFGSQGSGSFLMKLTALIAAIFFANSLALGYIAVQESKQVKKQSVLQLPVTPANTTTVTKTAAPAAKTPVEHSSTTSKTKTAS